MHSRAQQQWLLLPGRTWSCYQNHAPDMLVVRTGKLTTRRLSLPQIHSLVGCSPCVRFTCLVRLYISASSTVATLGMSGWLDLPQPGLPPGKKRQASLGALTPQLTASRQNAPFQFFPNRNMAAMRVTVGEGITPPASATKPCVPGSRHTAPQ